MDTLCQWPVTYLDCTGGNCSAWTKWPEGAERDAAKAAFEAEAAEYLWNWTGRVFGVCPVELRPCALGCSGDVGSDTFWGRGPWASGYVGGSSPFQPVLIGGLWHNISCGCLSSCSCGIDGAKTLVLPGPVASITAVKVDGQTLPESAYRLDYGRLLIRTDGQRWPACQDLSLEDTEVGTFSVAYQKGLPVPIGGQRAAGVLACELAKEACNDSSCQLPKRMSTMTREGVTVGFLDTFEGLDEGKLGIRSIDMWVLSVNRPKPFASVRSVDVPSGPRAAAGRTAWPTT